MHAVQERSPRLTVLVELVHLMVVHHRAILRVPRFQRESRFDHGDRYDLVIRKMDATEAALGNGVVPDSEGTLIPIIVRRRVAVFWTAFCMFLQRCRILGGLASGPRSAPAFAAACPRRIAETSVVVIMSLSGLGAAMKYPSTRSDAHT